MLRPLCAVAILALTCSTTFAQESSEVSVRLVSVRGEGVLADGAEPQVPAALEEFRKALTQRGMQRYAAVSRTTRRAPPGQLLDFPLPLGHRAQVVVRRDAGDKLQVRLEVHKPTGKENGPAWATVLTSEVKVLDGVLYAVRVEEMLEGAHLLILVSASSKRLE